MSSANPSGKAQKDRLAELEEQMPYLVEVPDSICYLEFRLDEISEKTDTIDAVAGRVEGLPIQELLARVDTLETNTNVIRTVNYERGDSSSGFAIHMEECVSELDSSQKTLLEMINGMSMDFRATLDVVRNEIADVNTRLSLTIDAKALENFTFDLEQYFKATNTVTEEAKVTLATMYLCEDAKMWWRSRYMDIQEGRCTIDTWDILKKELRSQFFLKNGPRPHAAYAAAERLFDLIGDSQDVKRHQSSSLGRNRNSCSSSPKTVGGDKRSARRLRLRWERDSGKMKAVNSIALPIVGLVKRTTIKLGGWKGSVDFVVVKMDNFDVVLGMEFLLEHQVIPMPSAKCLAITGSFPTEPPFVEIPLGALEKKEETVPKDTVCVPEKCHGVMPSSWPKSSSMRRRTDHGVESPSEAKAHAKNAYRMALPELAKLWKPSKMMLNTGFSRPVQAPYGAHVLSLKKKDRSPQQCVDRRTQSKLTVRTTKAKGLETTCVTEHEAYELPVVPLSLIDAKGGKCCSVQSQINVLGHVGECHQSGLSKKEDTQWSGNLECQAASNGLKQARIEGSSLGVVDATKTPKVEAEQFNLRTDSLIKRSLFEIKGKRHSVLPPLADGPYVGDRPQVHRVGEKGE
ncbi:uncharacterized protein E5676_scaffold45G00610 [Cucumis melo var. makuwa]|uniref:Retrotransposon gag domain-containing protein n=1 Tax=Cucumis melo var. makuwa TaxID=1194695 RepID=A0A5A7UKP3_CUCMM|nr:uncharacterized protein E6C27_scaffold131G001970 [Cucumis melo var. makuwa]TYK15024.1 uncharacterized protein E5676_scaffold45G00610 [Cucumis melo var. makuwa]